MKRQILPLEPSSYQRHLIHGEGRNWAETNCYVDLWVELLHALGFEPIAALPFTLTIDFEGDQWTFFKFPLADLYELYGLDVQELAIWRPLARPLEEQVTLGRPVLIELDSYYLPDTAGTAYQLAHVKTTVAVNEIDVEARRLGYFHNQGYYTLQDGDFANILHIDGPSHPAWLPPYTEIVKRRPGPALSAGEVLEKSLQLLRKHLVLVPDANPFVSFKARFEADLAWLTREGLEVFHQYSFATLRQFGADFELAATYLQWLQRHDLGNLEDPTASFLEISSGAKALQFQLARAMARQKTLDLSPLDRMAECWHSALASLTSQFLV
jgi:hypothetical protein